MLKLTPEGEKIVAGLAERYRIGTGAVMAMLEAVSNGGGTMAQFNIPEFGGGGQWMRGGMTMVGDMFNNTLKATVENLCSELSALLASQQALFMAPGQQQSQSQGGGPGTFMQSPFASSVWWPKELGVPSSAGSQNHTRYAYFPLARRLAIEAGGRVEVYDTLDHLIQGFSQQQSGDSSLTFSSQHGVVRVDRLPRISGTSPAPERKTQSAETASRGAESANQSQILALITQLGELRDKGLLTEDEFTSKKAELLKRM